MFVLRMRDVLKPLERETLIRKFKPANYAPAFLIKVSLLRGLRAFGFLTMNIRNPFRQLQLSRQSPLM